jgi:hypothetical protein
VLRRPLHGAPLRLRQATPAVRKAARSAREATTDYGVFPCALMDNPDASAHPITPFQPTLRTHNHQDVCPATFGHRNHRTPPMA